MKCDQCGASPAMVHLSEVRDGVKTDRHLCLACASKQGGLGLDASVEELLKKFVSEHSGPRQDEG